MIDALADLTRALHALPVAECLFDRRLAVTVPEALSADVDLEDLDAERQGRTRDELVATLLATRPRHEDLAVCHGDLCVPNVLFAPDTGEVSGVIDAGRLGVADRWLDLAIATRSLTSDLNPQYGSWSADRYLKRYGLNRTKPRWSSIGCSTSSSSGRPWCGSSGSGPGALTRPAPGATGRGCSASRSAPTSSCRR